MGDSEFARTNKVNLNAEPLDTRPTSAQGNAARTALEKCAAYTFNELEWDQERFRLVFPQRGSCRPGTGVPG